MLGVHSTGGPDFGEKSCAPDLKDQGFLFERRPTEDGSIGEMDENYLRVNVDPSALGDISELTLDMLDVANERLSYEEEAYFSGADGKIGLLNVVLAHSKMGSRLAQTEDVDMSNAISQSGYKAETLRKVLNTKLIFRETYSVTYDPHSMRFYPDDDFNDNVLPTFGQYNPLNPQTWPRLKRVFAYRPVLAGTAGIKYVFNDAFRLAPFGISTILTPRVIESQSFPDVQGVGSARKKGNLGYAGTAEWMNPDWPCNEDREMGFWKMRYGVAIKPWLIEEGYSFLHRIDQRIRLIKNGCPLPSVACDTDVSAYCYAGTGGSTADAIATENRPTAFHGSWF